MSIQKVIKISNTNSLNESVNVSEISDVEELDTAIIVNYQELNSKCDKVITKIKNRKVKK